MRLKYVDVAFRVTCDDFIRADHRYHLFSGLSEVVAQIHNGGPYAVHPLTGQQDGKGRVRLLSEARLVVRGPVTEIGDLLAIGGQVIRVGAVHLQCHSVPEVRQLLPATTLRSSLVTIKRSDKQVDEASFEEAVRKQLRRVGVSDAVQIELPSRLAHSGEIRSARRTFQIKGREIIGYEVRLHHLSAEESLAVQSEGIGGRRAMGCGLFKPFKPRAPGEKVKSQSHAGTQQ